MKANRKILIIIFVFLLFGLGLSSCADSSNNLLCIELDKDEININNDSVVPAVKLVFENEDKIAGRDDFWYIDNSKYVFVQDGKVFTTGNAPLYFETELNIILKDDVTKTAKLIVKKEIVELEGINIDVVKQKYTCLRGKSLDIIVELTPANTSYINYTLTLDEKANAQLDDNKLTVNNDATIGEEIVVTATSPKGLMSQCTITVVDTVKIRTAYDLYNIRQAPTLDYEIAVDEIDLSIFPNWIPVPNFSGTLNGNGKVISNLTIDIYSYSSSPMTQNYGLFATNYGLIENTILNNVNISSNINHKGGWLYAGSIAGANYGTINSVSVDGEIAVHKYVSTIGGIAGYSTGTISGCKTWVNLSGNGDMGYCRHNCFGS